MSYVARLLDLTPITAQRILQGIDVKLSLAFKLARDLGSTVEELWGGGA